MTESVRLDSLGHGTADEHDDAHAPVATEAPRSRSDGAIAAQSPQTLDQTKLFDLGQIDTNWDADNGTLWAFLTPTGRPNYSLSLVREAMIVHDETRRIFAHSDSPLRYFVLGSRFPGVFSLGGDLEMFADCVTHQDPRKLRDYGYGCVDVVHRLWHCNDMPIINIGLAQGDALGGGFETLLCFDVVIAERQARFGLPEVLFGLFPGMGAYSILARKLGHIAAERMILSGKVYTAEEMHEMGIVHILVEEGEGEAAVRNYIKSNKAHHSGMLGTYQAGRRVNPLTLQELRDIVDDWVEAALKLTAKDLKLMRRLASAQSQLHQK